MLTTLSRLSNGLWTLCLVPMEMPTEGQDPLQTGEPWRPCPGHSLPKRAHTLITPSSRKAIHFLYLLECNLRLIDYWLIVWLSEHMAHEWWGYWDCIYPSLVYVSLKEFGVVGSDTYTRGIKDFHNCWLGSLAKRRLCLGPASVINCTPRSALSFWVSLFPGTRG